MSVRDDIARAVHEQILDDSARGWIDIDVWSPGIEMEERIADAVLAALPRRWGMWANWTDDRSPALHMVFRSEREARESARQWGLLDPDDEFTVVSWIETEPEEVPDAGA